MAGDTYRDPEKFQDPLENYEPPTFSDPLERALHEETVAVIHSQPFVSVAPDTPIGDAMQRLAELRVACLLIAAEGKLLGVFSDRDALDKVVLEYEQLKNQPVSSAMTDNPIYVYDTDSSAAALSVMAQAGYRHVPVLDLDDQLVGIVSPQRVTEFLQKYFNEREDQNSAG